MPILAEPLKRLIHRLQNAPASRWWSAALLLWGAMILVVSARLAVQSPIKHTVFDAFALAGRKWVAGLDLYGNWNCLFRYTPTMAVAFVPFGVMPQRLGEISWRLLNAVAFLVAFRAWMQTCLAGFDSRKQAIATLLVMPLCLKSFNNGQANLLLTGMLLLSLVAMEKKRWNWAAIALAFAVILKLWPIAMAGLLLAIYPRQLGLRFVLALAFGLAMPFAFQRTDYVLDMYCVWADFLRGDLRMDVSILTGYRDMWLLNRLIGEPLSIFQYQMLQIGAGALAAAAIVWMGLRHVPDQQRVRWATILGFSWMILLGPATESCTYTLLSPFFAWAIFDPNRKHESSTSRVLLGVAVGMFVLVEVANIFPFSSLLQTCGLQPLGALALTLRALFTGHPVTQVEPEIFAFSKEERLAA